MTEPTGTWRDQLTGPPTPRTLPEMMLIALDIAEEDCRAYMGPKGYDSAREEFADRVGYDLYDALREILQGPILMGVVSSEPGQAVDGDS